MFTLNRRHIVGQKRSGVFGHDCKYPEPRGSLALFNLAIDSKLRGCDLVALRVGDIALSGAVRDRGVVVQKKTGRPVQFEITEQTRIAAQTWIARRGLREADFLFPSRLHSNPHM